MNYIYADNFCHKMFEIYIVLHSSILMEMTKAQLSSKGECSLGQKSEEIWPKLVYIFCQFPAFYSTVDGGSSRTHKKFLPRIFEDLTYYSYYLELDQAVAL